MTPFKFAAQNVESKLHDWSWMVPLFLCFVVLIISATGGIAYRSWRLRRSMHMMLDLEQGTRKPLPSYYCSSPPARFLLETADPEYRRYLSDCVLPGLLSESSMLLDNIIVLQKFLAAADSELDPEPMLRLIEPES
jgi:hypothetical protein